MSQSMDFHTTLDDGEASQKKVTKKKKKKGKKQKVGADGQLINEYANEGGVAADNQEEQSEGGSNTKAESLL